jgi:hypothetical protein
MKCYPHEIKDTNIITWVELYQSLYHGLNPVSALGTDTGSHLITMQRSFIHVVYETAVANGLCGKKRVNTNLALEVIL